jgi:hypothetical protein
VHSFGFDGERWESAWDGISARQRHLLQVQAADTLLGSVVAQLRKIGEYDSTMIVVTADHGASFTGGEPFRGVSKKNYPNILWTPLLIKAPGQSQGVVDDRCARSIDIVPTMLDHLGIAAPWHLDGRSLLHQPVDCRSRQIFEWEQNTVQPVSGSKYVSLPSQPGFSRVLHATAAPPGLPALRVYGIGKYGTLIGKDAAPLSGRPLNNVKATVDAVTRYDKVVADSPVAWWPLMTGRIGIPEVGVDLAIVANGKVVGLAQTFGSLEDGTREFATMVPTGLLRTEGNEIGLAQIVGGREHAQLRPISVTR